jgi:hypothetical protein
MICFDETVVDSNWFWFNLVNFKGHFTYGLWTVVERFVNML